MRARRLVQPAAASVGQDRIGLEESPLWNTPVAVVGASTGAFGAAWAQADLRKILARIGALVLQDELQVGGADSRFDEGGRLVDADVERELALLVSRLVEAAHAPGSAGHRRRSRDSRMSPPRSKGETMRTRFCFGAAIVAALALSAPSYAAFPDPTLQQASLSVVTNGRKPVWKLNYLLCYTGSGQVTASVSEFQYVQGAKFGTLQVQTRGEKTLQDPSARGAGGTCSLYHSETYRSKFPQRAGYVTGVTLQLFSDPGHVITRTFRLHP